VVLYHTKQGTVLPRERILYHTVQGTVLTREGIMYHTVQGTVLTRKGINHHEVRGTGTVLSRKGECKMMAESDTAPNNTRYRYTVLRS
jgi:hypothetical protein